MTIRTLLLSLLCLFGLPAIGHALQPGDTLPAIELDDAGGKTHTLDDSIARIYATGDRDGDKLLAEAMDKQDQSVLDAQSAIAIAEISAAPFFIKGIIKSSLRDRGYTTWVDSRGKTKKLLPYRPDQVSIIELDAMGVTAIRHVAKLDALRSELGLNTTPENDEAPANPDN